MTKMLKRTIFMILAVAIAPFVGRLALWMFHSFEWGSIYFEGNAPLMILTGSFSSSIIIAIFTLVCVMLERKANNRNKLLPYVPFYIGLAFTLCIHAIFPLDALISIAWITIPFYAVVSSGIGTILIYFIYNIYCRARNKT